MSATTPTTVEKQHVTRTPGVCGGKPCVAGTRIRVWDIVALTELGRSPDEVLVAYPRVTIADVYAALAYYHDHRDEIDREIAEDLRFAAEFRREQGPGTLDRMRELAGEGDAEVPSR